MTSDQKKPGPDAAAWIRTLLANRVRLYMAERMAMTEPLDNQEQNWIYGHMVDCAMDALQVFPPRRPSGSEPCAIHADADFSCVFLGRGCTKHPRLGQSALLASPPPVSPSQPQQEQDEGRCGVVGEPEAGRKVCELPAGHEGYHRQGGVSWLGYHPSSSSPPRAGEGR